MKQLLLQKPLLHRALIRRQRQHPRQFRQLRRRLQSQCLSRTLTVKAKEPQGGTGSQVPQTLKRELQNGEESK